MDKFSTVKVRDLRLGNVIDVGGRRFGRVYELAVTYKGEIRATYYYGSGDDVRSDVFIGEPDDVVLVGDDSLRIEDLGDTLYHGVRV